MKPLIFISLLILAFTIPSLNGQYNIRNVCIIKTNPSNRCKFTKTF